MLVVALFTAVSGFGPAVRPSPTRTRAPAVHMAQHIVSVDAKAWRDPPCGGRKSVWFDATCEAGHIGGCGIEVAELDNDGMRGGPAAGPLRPRAVLSGTLFVESRYRRQGIAQRLLREAETQARWWGCGELRLLVKAGNAPARRLYQKMGYVAHPGTLLHGSDVCMSRKLFMPNLHGGPLDGSAAPYGERSAEGLGARQVWRQPRAVLRVTPYCTVAVY